jgi:PAS domain S-box-containing protein
VLLTTQTQAGTFALSHADLEPPGAEHLLHLSEARYRALMAATGSLVWRCDPEGVILDLPEWHAYTGQPGSVITLDAWQSAVHPDDRERAAMLWDDAIARRGAYEAEYRLRRHDGAHRWFLDRAVPILEADGSIREWVGTATDINERRAAADEKLRTSEEQLRAVVLHAPMEVFALDLDGNFTLHLRGALDLANPQSGGWVGHSIHKTHASRPEAVANFHAAVVGHVSTLVEELESRVFETYWVPRYDGGGRIDGVMGTTIDVTDRARAQRAAEEIARLRSDFVAAVSHELRTPLTAIVGYAELLHARWPQLPDAVRLNQLSRIVVAANRQMRLVEDLLLLSQLETRSLTAKAEPLALTELVEQAIDEVRGAYANQPIFVRGDVTARVFANRSRTLQILVNMIDNAAKYSPEGAQILISWRIVGPSVTLFVRDSGTGIPEDGRKYLFTRFGRVPGSRARNGRLGTGLGLYLSRQLAEAMGGELDLEDTGNTGSTFRLWLPSPST